MRFVGFSNGYRYRKAAAYRASYIARQKAAGTYVSPKDADDRTVAAYTAALRETRASRQAAKIFACESVTQHEGFEMTHPFTSARAQWLCQQFPAREVLNDKGESQGIWITGPARLAFPSLWEPRSMQGTTNEAKYETLLLFPRGADLSVLTAAYRSAGQAKFGNKTQGARRPFRDQTEKAYDGFDDKPGAEFCKVSSLYKPSIYDERAEKMPDNDPRIYAGVWARATVRCFAYDNNGNRGVSFGLIALQRLADDEPFATGADIGAGIEAVAEMPVHLRATPTASAFVPGVPTGATANGHDHVVDDEIPF